MLMREESRRRAVRERGTGAASLAIVACLGIAPIAACSGGRAGRAVGSDMRASCNAAVVTRDAFVSFARHADGKTSSVVRQFWDGGDAQKVQIDGLVYAMTATDDAVYVAKDDGVYRLRDGRVTRILRAQARALVARDGSIFYADDSTGDLHELRDDGDRVIVREAPGEPGGLLVTGGLLYWKEHHMRVPDIEDTRRDVIWRVPVVGGEAEAVASVPGAIGAYCVRGKSVVFVDRGVPRDRLPELDDTRLVVVDPDGTQRAYPLPSEDIGGLAVDDAFAYLAAGQRIIRVDTSTGNIEDVAPAPDHGGVISVDETHVFSVDEHDQLVRVARPAREGASARPR